jgi:molecular chaperone GrpE
MKLRSTLISKGLEQVEVKAGDAFDADFAEAITQILLHRLRKGKIVDVLEKDINWEIKIRFLKWL